MHRSDIHAAPIARAFDNLPSRRRARTIAARVTDAVATIGRLSGNNTVPHRIARRLGRLVITAPPAIGVFEPTPAGIGRDASGRRILLVSNDLSRSGAPRIVVELARLLLARGDGVTVLSGADGPYRDELVAAGTTVIVDPSIIDTGAFLPSAIADGFDVALCNTIETAACAAAIAGQVPTVLYTHEVSLLEERLARSTVVPAALASVAQLWAGSELSAALVRPIRSDVVTIPYGLDPIRRGGNEPPPVGRESPANLTVLASFEPRKGQDLLVQAMAMLDPAVRAGIRIRMFGRILFPDFHAALVAQVVAMPGVSLHGPLDEAGYQAALLASDAVVIPSRSDTLPLVSLDALGAARLLVCTRSTGTADYIESGKSGFVAESATAPDIAATLHMALERRAEWHGIALAGQRVFERHFSRAAFSTLVGARIDALAAGSMHRA